MSKHDDPKRIDIGDKPFICPACGNDRFNLRSAQLNTAVASFFNFDWANRSATCLVCSKCTHISWFLNPPKK